MQLEKSPHSIDHKTTKLWLVTWDTAKDTKKKDRKSDRPQHPKPTNCACKIGYNNAMVAYKPDNALVAKYLTSEERRDCWLGSQPATMAAKHPSMKKTSTAAKHPQEERP